MKGLENILFQIENESSEKAAVIVKNAEKTAEEIIDEAVLKSEELSNEIRGLADKRAEELISRAETADGVKLSRARLLKKQEIIKNTLEKAKCAVKEQKAEEYFAFLEKLLAKYAQKESGMLLISANDEKLVTDGFKESASKLGLKIENGNIADRNGFILVYGSIEINCTVDAIFDSAAEEISDMLNSFLFGGEGGI